jgi:hypothetical protein
LFNIQASNGNACKEQTLESEVLIKTSDLEIDRSPAMESASTYQLIVEVVLRPAAE